MPKIKEELEKVKENDLYSLLLFVLYQVKNIPEYSSLSELAFVFKKDTLLQFIEYFGGQTIKVPTIDELEDVTYAILLYKYVRIDDVEFNRAVEVVSEKPCNISNVKKIFRQLDDILRSYNFK